MMCGNCGSTFIEMDDDDDFRCVMCSRVMINRGKPKKSTLPKEIQKKIDAMKDWS